MSKPKQKSTSSEHIRIDISDPHWLVKQVTEALYRKLQEDCDADMVQAAVDKAVREKVEAAASAMVPKALALKIQEVIDGDFGTTNDYGRHEPKTIKSLIATRFTTNRYSSQSEIDKMVSAKVAEVMAKEFEPQIKAAREELRKRIDHLLGEKVALAVREAVGLR